MARLTKAESERLQKLSEHIYINDTGITLKALSEKVGVSEITIGKWAKLGKWEDKRVSLLTTKSHQLAFLYNQLQNINKTIAERDENNFASTKEANTIIQLTAAIKNLETETSLGDIIQVAKDLVDFVRENDLELAKTIAITFDQYINTKAI